MPTSFICKYVVAIRLAGAEHGRLLRYPRRYNGCHRTRYKKSVSNYVYEHYILVLQRSFICRRVSLSFIEIRSLSHSVKPVKVH